MIERAVVLVMRAEPTFAIVFSTDDSATELPAPPKLAPIARPLARACVIRLSLIALTVISASARALLSSI